MEHGFRIVFGVNVRVELNAKAAGAGFRDQMKRLSRTVSFYVHGQFSFGADPNG
jgi:hypothetical protein